MTSTGNDIIDLSQTDQERSIQRRFFSKFIAVSEEELFHGSATPLSFAQFVWLAWSVKESAFKYLKRHSPELVFSPVNIIILQLDQPLCAWPGSSNPCVDDCYTGALLANGQVYYFRSLVDTTLISTVVSDHPEFNNLHWKLQKIDAANQATQSAAVRSLLLQSLETHLPGAILRVEKSAAGYPVVLQNDRPLALPVSFSHHHSYIACSFLL